MDSNGGVLSILSRQIAAQGKSIIPNLRVGVSDDDERVAARARKMSGVMRSGTAVGEVSRVKVSWNVCPCD